MSGASAVRVTVIAKYFWPLSSTMLPDKKALDVVGVIGSRPSAYLIRLGIPSPAGLAPFSSAPPTKCHLTCHLRKCWELLRDKRTCSQSVRTWRRVAHSERGML